VKAAPDLQGCGFFFEKFLFNVRKHQAHKQRKVNLQENKKTAVITVFFLINLTILSCYFVLLCIFFEFLASRRQLISRRKCTAGFRIQPEYDAWLANPSVSLQKALFFDISSMAPLLG
jgi:hypothetical protein